MDQKMDQFFEELLIKAGLTSLSDEFKLSYKEKIFQQLMDRIGLKSLNELSDAQIVEYKKMVNDNTPQEELGLFLQKNVPDFENFVKQEMIKFGQDFVDFTTKGKPS